VGIDVGDDVDVGVAEGFPDRDQVDALHGIDDYGPTPQSTERDLTDWELCHVRPLIGCALLTLNA
jgi:hypothetical protein